MTEQLTDYRVMLCGKATFTLESSGKAYTYRVTRKESEGRDPAFFVSLLTGPDNEGDYTYLGMLQARAARFITTGKSRLPADSDPCKGFQWLASKLAAGSPLPGGVRLLWADKCQRCGRTLTVPSSIDARLGPDCAGRV